MCFGPFLFICPFVHNFMLPLLNSFTISLNLLWKIINLSSSYLIRTKWRMQIAVECVYFQMEFKLFPVTQWRNDTLQFTISLFVFVFAWPKKLRQVTASMELYNIKNSFLHIILLWEVLCQLLDLLNGVLKASNRNAVGSKSWNFSRNIVVRWEEILVY